MSDRNIYRFLLLTAEQTAVDLNLGDVVLQPIRPECSVRIRVDPRRGNSIVLMNATTGEVFSSLLNKEGFAATRIDDEEGIIHVPAGNYYVVTGFLMLDKPVMQLLELVRAGKAENHPEIPSFVATPDKEVSVTIDPKETIRKIKAAAEAEGIPVG